MRVKEQPTDDQSRWTSPKMYTAVLWRSCIISVNNYSPNATSAISYTA